MKKYKHTEEFLLKQEVHNYLRANNINFDYMPDLESYVIRRFILCDKKNYDQYFLYYILSVKQMEKLKNDKLWKKDPEYVLCRFFKDNFQYIKEQIKLT